MIHGHLTPHNIFLEGTNVYIGDFEFISLRKYASLFANYKNKSAYTAPEILREKGNTTISKTKKSDIYSIGMIIW